MVRGHRYPGRHRQGEAEETGGRAARRLGLTDSLQVKLDFVTVERVGQAFEQVVKDQR